MINIKKIIFLIFLTLIYLTKTDAEISDSLFMTVGNKAVTKLDIVNEIKVILVLNNETYSDEKRDQLHQAAIQSIIRRNIKLIEIEKHEFFDFNDADLQRELIKLASNINVDLDTLKNICESNSLDFSLIINQVKVELFWNSLIFQLYKSELSIDPDEINEQLKKIENKKKTNEYLISEILIKTIEKEKLESEIKELKNKIKAEGFENVAKNLSISESAINGGDLGWINENEISKEVRSTITSTAIGTVSKPIILSQGILLFKINDKREIKTNLTMEEKKNRIVAYEKNKILNMHSLSHYDKLQRSISVKFIQ